MSLRWYSVGAGSPAATTPTGLQRPRSSCGCTAGAAKIWDDSCRLQLVAHSCAAPQQDNDESVTVAKLSGRLNILKPSRCGIRCLRRTTGCAVTLPIMPRMEAHCDASTRLSHFGISAWTTMSAAGSSLYVAACCCCGIGLSVPMGVGGNGWLRWSSMDGLLRYFLRQPSLRIADRDDRERNEIHLRGWNRSPGLGALRDSGCGTPHPP